MLEDETELIGTIVKNTDSIIVLRTPGDVLITVAPSDVKDIEAASGETRGGVYYREDPNDTRMFLAPSARSIKRFSENWIPLGADVAINSFGVIFFGECLSTDLGFMRPTVTGGGGFPFLPWVGFAYNFGS